MAYIQATSVGGTHPALIESMAAGNLVLAFGTPENREVTAGTALIFDDQAQLTEALTQVVQAPDSPEHQALRAAARARAEVDLLLARHRRPVRGAIPGVGASIRCQEIDAGDPPSSRVGWRRSVARQLPA